MGWRCVLLLLILFFFVIMISGLLLSEMCVMRIEEHKTIFLHIMYAFTRKHATVGFKFSTC